jgi:hypothetical protein
MFIKLLTGALLIAGATSASAITFAGYDPTDNNSNLSLSATSLTSSSEVVFYFLDPDLAPAGFLSAALSLTATETNAVSFPFPSAAKPTIAATFDGSFDFIYDGPTGTFGGTNFTNGDILLHGVFSDAVLSGSGSTGSLVDSVLGDGIVFFSSDFLDFDPLEDEGMSISITSISPSLKLVGSTLRNFSGVSSGTFEGTVTHNVHNDVPEPESWALMVAGFGVMGLAMRRTRRTISVVTA